MEFGKPAKITPREAPPSAPTMVNCQSGLGEKNGASNLRVSDKNTLRYTEGFFFTY